MGKNKLNLVSLVTIYFSTLTVEIDMAHVNKIGIKVCAQWAFYH